MLPSSVAVIVSSLLAPRIVRRMSASVAVPAGLATTGTGLALLTLVSAESGMALPVIASVVFTLGVGPVFIFTTDLILGSAPPERAGAASAISETGAEFGGAMGIAVLGSIGTAVYRASLEGQLPPGLSAPAAEAARDTLGGALTVAQGLPAQANAALTESARIAFTSGLRLSTGIAAAVAFTIAAVTRMVLRRAD